MGGREGELADKFKPPRSRVGIGSVHLAKQALFAEVSWSNRVRYRTPYILGFPFHLNEPERSVLVAKPLPGRQACGRWSATASAKHLCYIVSSNPQTTRRRPESRWRGQHLFSSTCLPPPSTTTLPYCYNYSYFGSNRYSRRHHFNPLTFTLQRM